MSLFTGDERKWCHADDWKWTAYGLPSKLSARDVWPHEDLLDIQVSDSRWPTVRPAAECCLCVWGELVFHACCFHVFQGRWEACIYCRWAKITRVLLWHCTMILHMDVMRLCKLLVDEKTAFNHVWMTGNGLNYKCCCKTLKIYTIIMQMYFFYYLSFLNVNSMKVVINRNKSILFVEQLTNYTADSFGRFFIL